MVTIGHLGILPRAITFITCEKQCFKVTKDGSEVFFFREEANTPMLLYIKHASSSYISKAIVTEDTDGLSFAFQYSIR